MPAAVLIIDVQEIMCSGEQAAYEVERVINRINLVSRKARAAGALVVVIQHETQGGEMDYGTDSWKLDPALEIYAEVFEEEGALDRLEAFASLNGPAFYRLPVNQDRVILRREVWTVPERVGRGDLAVVPFMADERLRWRLAS